MSELSIPVLLLWSRTRHLGIALALAFHFALAASPVVLVADFTTLIYALMVFFGPPDLGERLAGEWSAFRKRWPRLINGSSAVGPALRYGALLLLLTAAVGRGWLLGDLAWILLTWATFLLYMAIVVSFGLYILGATGWLVSAGARLLRPLRPTHGVLLVAIVLNAASPYLGLKTTSSLTMFSNLRTEGGTTNHLVLPRLSLANYQDDLVRIVETNHPELSAIAGRGELITFHELRRAAGAYPDLEGTFARGRQEIVLGGSGETTLQTLSPLEAKLLHFRPVAANGHPRCQA